MTVWTSTVDSPAARPVGAAGRITLRPTDDYAWWDGLVAGHRDGTPFHLSGFLLTYARLFGLELELTQALVDDEPVGAVPLLVRRRGPVALVNGLDVPYHGPLLADGLSPADVMPAIRRHLRPWPVARYTVRSVREQPLPEGRGWRTLPNAASAVLPVVADPQGDVTASFDRNQRKVLRRAERAGVVTGHATRAEIAEYLTAWEKSPYLRQGRAPGWPEGARLAVYDALAPSGVAEGRAVRQNGEVLAVIVNLRLGERLIHWEVGLSEAARQVGASTLLAADALRRARETGCTVLDMLGCPTPGIATFKRTLGAELKPYGVAQWTSAAVPTTPWAQQALRRVVRALAPDRSPG